MTQAPLQASQPSQPAPASAEAAGVMAEWQCAALVYDYRQAANPVRAGLTEPIPYRCWPPELHQHGPTRVIPLDLSEALGCPGPATSPGLAAHFLRIEAGEGLKAAAAATSSLFYVLQGSGRLRWNNRQLAWASGDLIVLPSGDTPCWMPTPPARCTGCTTAPCSSTSGCSPARPASRPATTRQPCCAPTSTSCWPIRQPPAATG